MPDAPAPPPPPPPPPSPPPQPATSGWKGLPIWLRLAIGIVAFGVLAGAAVILFVVVLGGATATVATIGQEERALEAEAESATRNAALEVEAAATGNGGQYPGDVLGVIDAAGPWPVDFTVGSSSPEEFCIQATHPELPDRGVLVHYDSDGGGIDGGPCP